MADDPLGDLIAEELVPIVADLAQLLREEGAEAVRGALLRVEAVEAELSPELAARLAHTPGGTWAVALVLAVAMVSPDAGMRTLLGWTDTLRQPHRAARDTTGGGWDPPVERERQRLVAAGVPADTAILLAARGVQERQDTARSRKLRAVRDCDVA